MGRRLLTPRLNSLEHAVWNHNLFHECNCASTHKQSQFTASPLLVRSQCFAIIGASPAAANARNLKVWKAMLHAYVMDAAPSNLELSSVDLTQRVLHIPSLLALDMAVYTKPAVLSKLWPHRCRSIGNHQGSFPTWQTAHTRKISHVKAVCLENLSAEQPIAPQV